MNRELKGLVAVDRFREAADVSDCRVVNLGYEREHMSVSAVRG